jgi:hypothetical protein
MALAAASAGLLTRVLLCTRFRQPWWTVPMHPLSLITLTAIQWWSLWLQCRGRRAWRGRVAGA